MQKGCDITFVDDKCLGQGFRHSHGQDYNWNNFNNPKLPITNPPFSNVSFFSLHPLISIGHVTLLILDRVQVCPSC